MSDSVPHHLGHRQRLRERLLTAGETSLSDYELLEMCLYLSQPRGDTKPLAKELLKKFGTLGRVFQAPLTELKSQKGMGDTASATFLLIHAIALRMGRAELEGRPVLSDMESLVRYARLRVHDFNREQFHILYLDKKKKFIGDEIHQIGTVDYTMVYPREFMKEALHRGACHMILFHNHPSGDCTPSEKDLIMTQYLIDLGDKISVQVLDHFIISTHDYLSMKEKNILDFEKPEKK